MKVIIEAPFSVSDDLDKDIKDKLHGLQKYENKITQANVFFKLNDGSVPDTILSEIRLRIPGYDLFASAFAEQALSAFTSAANQVKSQLLKRKEIIKAKR